jgi:hypothetical protein
MKSTIKHAPIGVAFAIIIALASCQKKDTANLSGTLNDLSPKTQSDLVASQANWNRYASGAATLASYKVTGAIGDESARQSVIDGILNDNSYVASGNVLDASGLQVLTVKDLGLQNGSVRDSLLKYASDRVAVGDKIVTIQWQKGEASFTTQCIVAESGIVWDNILTNVFMLNTVPTTTKTNSPGANNGGNKIGDAIQPQYIAAWYSLTNTWTLDWIWGSTRGTMGEEITIYCYSNAHVYSTDNSDWANMDLGSAKSYSKVLVNSGSYGKIQYALGLATPTVSLSFSSSNFKVSASGVGSNEVANGTRTLTPYNVN